MIEALQAWLPLIKDIVTTLAAATAAIIAIIGLQTWKKQLKGKTEYELAQRLAKATYKTREAIAEVRRPYITEGEEIQAMKETNTEGDPSDHAKDFTLRQKAVYNWRWQKAREAFIELDAVSLEAEAIWGKPSKIA